MRATLVLVLFLAIAPRSVFAETITVPLNLPTASAPTTSLAAPIGDLAARLVESSNFNSYTRPEVVKQSIPEIQAHYRQVAAGNNLVITYASPVKFVTVGGDLWVLEIVIGLGSPDRIDALFTIDNAGRVVAHAKYSGSLAVELRKAADGAVGLR
jgi:hypothetical protein